MAYVGSICLNGGETIDDAINEYFNLKTEGLTQSDTSIKINNVDYPIGYFDKDNIDVFKLGITTIKNIGFVVDKGGEVFGDEYKQHSDYFIDKAFEVEYNYPDDVMNMLERFSDAAYSMKIELFDTEQKSKIKELTENKLQKYTTQDKTL